MKNLFNESDAPTFTPVRGLSEFRRFAPCDLDQTRMRGISGKTSAGFTLTELLITLAVVVILTIVAVPSFKTLIYSSRLTSTSNDMVAALNLARLEAVKSNATVQLCSDSAAANTTDTLGTACTTQAGAVYLWPSSSSSAVQVLARVGGIVAPLQLSGSVAALRFNGQGLAQQVGTTTLFGSTVADICTAAISTGNHRVVAMVGGSIITTSTTTGSCP